MFKFLFPNTNKKVAELEDKILMLEEKIRHLTESRPTRKELLQEIQKAERKSALHEEEEKEKKGMWRMFAVQDEATDESPSSSYPSD
nr:hypothetical protein TetV2_00147 [Oceanusvirus sp.]